MKKDQARIIILEDALIEAQHLVEFLHGCLTNPHYKYSYPDQTIRRLEKWNKLVPLPDLCVHSITKKGCKACVDRNERKMRLYEANLLSR